MRGATLRSSAHATGWSTAQHPPREQVDKHPKANKHSPPATETKTATARYAEKTARDESVVLVQGHMYKLIIDPAQAAASSSAATALDGQNFTFHVPHPSSRSQTQVDNGPGGHNRDVGHCREKNGEYHSCVLLVCFSGTKNELHTLKFPNKHNGAGN